MPTPGAAEFLRTCADTGRPVAIVSYNAHQPVEHYLDKHHIRDLVVLIAARSTANPMEMKPRPALPLQAMTALEAAGSECVLIGDSPRDMQVARDLDVPAIGYANKPGNAGRRRDAGAASTTNDMLDLARAALHFAA